LIPEQAFVATVRDAVIDHGRGQQTALCRAFVALTERVLAQVGFTRRAPLGTVPAFGRRAALFVRAPARRAQMVRAKAVTCRDECWATRMTAWAARTFGHGSEAPFVNHVEKVTRAPPDQKT
jgi:hypothetical protein